MSNNNFFDELKQKTNVSQEDLFGLANSVTNETLQDEQSIRDLIGQIAALANVNVPEVKQEEIVKAILQNKLPLDFASLTQLLNQGK